MADDVFTPSHTDEEKAQITAALDRNQTLDPLRDDEGNVVHQELAALYADSVHQDEVIAAAQAAKRVNTDRITEIEAADAAARMTGVTMRI